MSLSVVVFSVKVLYIGLRRPYVDWVTDLIQGVMAVVNLILININFFVRHNIKGYKTIATSLFALAMASTAAQVVAVIILVVIALKSTQVAVVHVRDIIVQERSKGEEEAEMAAREAEREVQEQERARLAAEQALAEAPPPQDGVLEVLSARMAGFLKDIFGAKGEKVTEEETGDDGEDDKKTEAGETSRT